MASTGRIEKLVLHNFKSYRGSQRIGPFRHNFSAIVGPNGAGKSNLMDAICFVLGVNAPSLRSARLIDLVYREHGTVEVENGEASVQLIFEKPDGEQICFQRSIVVRNGSSSGVYRVNDNVVSAAGYEERLKELNILVRAKNFLVFQGDVSNIGSGANMALTELFEHVSGSAELRDEYERLKREMERAEEHAAINFQRKKGLKAQEKQFKEQRQEAKKYEDTLAQYSELQRDILLFEVYHINHQLESARDERDEAQEALTGAEQDLEEAEQRLKAEQKKAASSKKGRVRGDRALAAKQKEWNALNPEIISVREQIKHLEARLERDRGRLAELQKEDEQHEAEMVTVRQQLDELKRVRAEFERNATQRAAGQVQLDDDQLERYNELKEQAAGQTYEQRKQLSSAQNAAMLLQEERVSVQARFDALEQRKAVLETDLRACRARDLQMQTAIEENNRREQQLRSEVREKEELVKNATEEREQLAQQLFDVQEKLREAKMERQQSLREQRFQDTLNSLMQLYPGVSGTLVELATPKQRKYQVALSVAMGRFMDAIIVDTKKTALECITYMKEQRAGIATFLALDSIHPKPVQERLRTLRNAKLAIDLLDFDQKYEVAVRYAVGNTLITDHEKDARRFAFGKERQKAVALNGTVVNRSGLISGGAASAGRSAAKWDEKKAAKLKKKRDAAMQRLQDIAQILRSESQVEELRVQVQGLQSRTASLQADKQHNAQRIAELTAELQTVQSDADAVQPDLDRLQGEIEQQERDIAKIEAAIHRVEDDVFRTFCAQIGVEHIRQYESDTLGRAQVQNAMRLEMSKQETRLTQMLQYGETRDTSGPVEACEAQIAESTAELKKLRRKEKQVNKKEQQLMQAVESLKRDAMQQKQAEREAQEGVKEARRVHADCMQAVQHANSSIGEAEGRIRVLLSERHAVLRRATVEEIELPLQDEEELEFREPETSQSQYNVYEREDELEFDFSGLPRSLLSAKEPEEYHAAVEDLQAKASQLATLLARMNPNMKAGSKLAEAAKKVARMQSQLDSARKQGKTAAQRFHEVKKERNALFHRAFDHVSKKIGDIYERLTRSERSARAGGQQLPGGKAFLTIQNPSEPFNGGITYQTIPPSKRLWSFEQLSGGERSIASLALIFAIHSFKPSPFFVLDEIDAALDPHNVQKVTRFVLQSSASTQFIIISLKDSFFSKADGLVGVYKDNEAGCSRTLTVELAGRQYG